MSRRRSLTRERVLEAAIRLADDGGLEALSMRRLARELGVEAMSLYNHVANKDDLVDAIVDLVVAEIELPEARDWDDAVRTCAISAHEVLLRHPWACALVIAPKVEPGMQSARLRYMEWLLRRLRDAGFPPELAYSAYHAIDSHILGFTMWQLGHGAAAQALLGDKEFADFAKEFLERARASEFRYLAEHVEQHLAAAPGDGAREYEFALDLVLEGLRHAHESVRSVGFNASRP